jgi:hypothetical protein
VTRSAVVCCLALLAGACVNLQDIQQQHPVRSLIFNGSYQAVAGCVQQRLHGKVSADPFEKRYVIYDAVKNMEMQGLTHYSITIGHWSIEQGQAQWRIMEPKPGSGRTRKIPLADTAVRQIWAPVEECAANARDPNQASIETIRRRPGVEVPSDQTTFGDDYGDIK